MKIRNFIFLSIFVLTLVTITGCTKTKNIDNERKISFNSNGGSSVQTLEALKSSKITAPTNPIKNGYSFGGWYTDPELTKKFQFTYMPSENMTLYAKWNLMTYVITYNLDNGENNSSNPDIYNVLQNDITLENPTRNGFYFDGWYTDSDFLNTISVIETSSAIDYELYAKWNENELASFTINYHLDDGINGDNPSNFNSETTNIVLAPATKEGYTFKGWYTDSGLKNPITMIDTSIGTNYDLYAKFEKNSTTPIEKTYSITYYMNGGTTNDNPIRYTEDMDIITLKDPVKVSCTFKGWFLDQDFTSPVTEIDCSKKQDITLYAKWLNGITEVTYDFDFGIGKEYVLYHVSDTHINAGTSKSDLDAEASWMTGRFEFAKSFGESYNEKNLFKSSTETLEAIIDYINSQAPTAVCYTGDLMDYYSVSNFNYVNTTLVKTEVPYVYALGNHESPSSGYTGMTGMDTTAFTVIDFGDFEIVCLDDSNKDINENYTFTEEQYNLLKAETDKNKPIIIAIHVPLLTRYNCDSRLEDCGSYYFIDENSCSSASQKVIDLICNNSNIKMVLCGHIHGGLKTYIAPNKPQINCSSGLIGIINKITIR